MEKAESTQFVYVYQLRMLRPFKCNRIYKSEGDATKAITQLQMDLQNEADHDAKVFKQLAVYDSDLKRVTLVNSCYDIDITRPELDFLRGYQAVEIQQ